MNVDEAVSTKDRFNPNTIHAELHRLAKSKAEMDYEIGQWILCADRVKLHVTAGVTFVEYIGRIFDWDGRTVQSRLLTAQKLERLPLLTDELQAGRVNWSFARELARIAEPETEKKWIEELRGKSIREVEDEVSGHEPNAKPGDDKDPRKRTYAMRFDMKAEGFGRVNQAISRAIERNPGMTSEDAILHMAEAYLTKREADATKPAGCTCACESHAETSRSANIVGYSICTSCQRGVMHAGKSGNLALTPEAIERLECDAVVIRNAPDGTPGRVSHVIPPTVRRETIRLSGGHCEVPGCPHEGDDLHHIRLLCEGGTHDKNLLVHLCKFHHNRFHDGYLLIEGSRLTGFDFRYADGRVYGVVADPLAISACAEVFRALTRMGHRDDDTRAVLSEVRARFQAAGKPFDYVPLFGAALALIADKRAAKKAARKYSMKRREPESVAGEASPIYGGAHVDAVLAELRSSAHVDGGGMFTGTSSPEYSIAHVGGRKKRPVDAGAKAAHVDVERVS